MQVILQIHHQITAPDSLPCIAQIVQSTTFQALFQPSLHIHVATGAVIDLFHDLRNQPIVTAKALGVHKGTEIQIVFRILIGSVQNAAHRHIPQFTAFIFVTHTEIRGYINSVCIFTQQISAERVNCRNLRQIEPLNLLLQMAVFGFLRNSLCQLCRNLSPQFRSCRFGVGYDQKIIQICRINAVSQITHQSINQHLGFTGDGSRRNQKISTSIRHRNSLLRRKLIGHVHPPPFRSLPRTAGQS